MDYFFKIIEFWEVSKLICNHISFKQKNFVKPKYFIAFFNYSFLMEET